MKRHPSLRHVGASALVAAFAMLSSVCVTDNESLVQDGAIDGSGTGSTGGTGGTITIPAGTGVSSFHCFNWADQRDNFVDGTLLLSGTLGTDTTADAITPKATTVLAAFTDQLKANTVRMPINEPTVNGSYWSAYKAAIDVAISKGMKVILAFWAKDKNIGRPADINVWYTMWQTVVDAYLGSPLVYFDIHNEPHGYTQQEWVQQVNDWMAQYPSVPANRIIVAGTGWDDNFGAVATVFPDMFLEIHDYAFNNSSLTTEAAWESELTARLAGASSRTLVGEWGTKLTGNVDFSTGTEGDNSKSFMVGMANAINLGKMGSCYWPGLRTGDLWGMLTANGSTYTIVNQSALDLVWHSWGAALQAATPTGGSSGTGGAAGTGAGGAAAGGSTGASACDTTNGTYTEATTFATATKTTPYTMNAYSFPTSTATSLTQTTTGPAGLDCSAGCAMMTLSYPSGIAQYGAGAQFVQFFGATATDVKNLLNETVTMKIAVTLTPATGATAALPATVGMFAQDTFATTTFTDNIWTYDLGTPASLDAASGWHTFTYKVIDAYVPSWAPTRWVCGSTLHDLGIVIGNNAAITATNAGTITLYVQSVTVAP